jgi:lactoylglutathione lyase
MRKFAYTMIFVSDMKRSVEFYRDVLGLPLKFESPGWTEFATEGTTLALHPADSLNPERSARGHFPAGSCHPGFEVENLDHFHQTLLAKGVMCIRLPQPLEGGSRLAIYQDPDGLPLSVAETKAPSKE